MCWERIDDPNQIVKVGETVRVQVLSIELEQDPPGSGWA